MKKRYLSLFCVAFLASCGSDAPAFVSGGEKFDAEKLQAVDQEVVEEKTSEIHGVTISASTNTTMNMTVDGQSQSSSESSTVVETFNFDTKTLEVTMTSGGHSLKYQIKIENDSVKFISDDIPASAAGMDLTLEGFGTLLETSYKSLFSWSFIPSSEDIQALTQALEGMMASMQMTVTLIGFEDMMNGIAKDFVMAGDYQNGNFEVGFDKAHEYTCSMRYSMEGTVLGNSVLSIAYSKMRCVFKDFLCRESFACITEKMNMVISAGGYSTTMNMTITADTHSTYSYF